MKNYLFGVDVGGTMVKLGLFDTEGKLLDKWSIVTELSDDEKSILRDIWAAIEAKMQEKAIAKEDVQGIGMGVPGPVLADGTVNRCVNLNWGRFNVKAALEEISGLPVAVGNDANVAALGEQWMGGGAGHSNVVMVTLGTGVGGGIILDGKIVTGSFGAAGEIGHMHMVDGETKACGCGKFGCLEQYTSANGIILLAQEYIAEHGENGTKLGHEVPIDSINIFKAAREGDATANGIIDEMFDLLGRSLAAVSNVIDPEAYVIGGGVSKEGQYLADGIEKAFKKYAFHASEGAKILLAKLGNDAGIYGAARMVMEN